MILDAVTLDQVGAVDDILAGVGRPRPSRVRSRPSCSPRSSRRRRGSAPTSRRSRERSSGCGAPQRRSRPRRGLAIAAAGTHPFARPESQPVVQEERYTSFERYGGISVRRQGVQGLHVHVGVATADDCWRCLEAILPWLPVVLALSANSPWLAGERTGMASNRALVLARAPARVGSAAVRVVRGVGAVGRAARAARRDAGLHADLVGRAAASPVRHARGARARPAHRRRARGRVRRPPAGALRDRARRRPASQRTAARRPRARRLRAEPLGGRALRATGGAAPSGR